MIAAALDAEVDVYVGPLIDEAAEKGKRVVVRKRARPRARVDGRLRDGARDGPPG